MYDVMIQCRTGTRTLTHTTVIRGNRPQSGAVWVDDYAVHRWTTEDDYEEAWRLARSLQTSAPREVIGAWVVEGAP